MKRTGGLRNPVWPAIPAPRKPWCHSLPPVPSLWLRDPLHQGRPLHSPGRMSGMWLQRETGLVGLPELPLESRHKQQALAPKGLCPAGLEVAQQDPRVGREGGQAMSPCTGQHLSRHQLRLLSDHALLPCTYGIVALLQQFCIYSSSAPLRFISTI